MPSFDNGYARQLALLVDVLPWVAREEHFALKGGTAINLFFRDLPRLSVDIDLAWLPRGDRSSAIRGIDAALQRIAASLRTRLACQVQLRTTADGVPVGLTIRRQRVGIKIDVTPVLRGSVFDPEIRTLRPAAADRFGLLEVRTLGFADLFAGKLVAALDRQHPRDLFDVMHLLANEGITDELWSAFLVYLTAANRRVAEMLDPRRVALHESFVAEFAGMTEDTVAVAQLEQARESLIASLQARLETTSVPSSIRWSAKRPNGIASACRCMFRSCRACNGKSAIWRSAPPPNATPTTATSPKPSSASPRAASPAPRGKHRGPIRRA